MNKHDLYLKKIEAKLKQYNAKLTQVKSQASEIQIDTKLEYLSQVEILKKKHSEFAKKHEELKSASEHSWEDIKDGTEKAWADLEEAFEKVVTRFK